MHRLWHLFFPDRYTLSVFLLALFVFLTIFSAGFYLNDEMEQGTNLYNLLRGDLTIEEIPEHYYVSQSGIRLNPRFEEYGGHRYIAASHGMSVFSLPFYYGLAAADAVMGVEVFFPLLWSMALGALLYLSSDFIALYVKKKWPDMQEVKKKIGWMAIGAPIVLFIVNLWLLQPLSFELWGPPIAMQFMSLTFVALGLAVLFRFFRLYFTQQMAFLASFVLLAASPVAFWAIGQKYHGLNFALLVFAFAAFCYGKRESRTPYHYASYVFASLAIWVQLYSGAVILLSLLAVDLATARGQRLRTLSLALAVTLLSLTPYFAENYLTYDNPLYPGYIAKGNVNVIPPDPPEIQVVYPLSGDTVTGNVTVRYNVSSNTESSTVTYINAAGNQSLLLHQDTGPQVTCSWNTTAVDEGLAVLRITARTWRGDTTEKNVSVMVDNSPPSLEILMPAESSVLSGSYRLLCHVTPDVGVINYSRSRDGTQWQALGADTTPYDSYTWNTTAVQGDHWLKAEAIDGAGYTASHVVPVTIDNSGEHLILQSPQDREAVSGTCSLQAVVPPGISRMAYQYRLNGTWHDMGMDETPETPYTWDTFGFTLATVDIRCLGYGRGETAAVDVNRDILIDNRPPSIAIQSPSAGEKIFDAPVIAYNASGNTAFVEAYHSPDNATWSLMGVAAGGQSLILPENLSMGRAVVRLVAHSQSGLTASDQVSFVMAQREEMGALGRLAFIVNSLEVGWNFMERVSALGQPEKIPVNLYKSFFDARGTQARFAFFVFTPFLILSLFAPLAYLQKKKKFGLPDALMLTYIVLHLFIFVNISIYQGDGYDMRWYLPLHLPFLYFGMVSFNYVFKTTAAVVLKSYVMSLAVLYPTFAVVLWALRLRGSFYLFRFSRLLGDGAVIFLLLAAILFLFVPVLYKGTSKDAILKKISLLLSSLAGVSLFVSTWTLSLVMLVYSPRGIGGISRFTFIVPLSNVLQDVLQHFLR